MAEEGGIFVGSFKFVLLNMFYEKIVRPILFRLDPERMHDLFVSFGQELGDRSLGRAAVGTYCRYSHPALNTKVCGIDFENPVGLAAGFDKDARLTRIIPAVGFGFMEVGSVTRHPYGGNPGLRLARLPKDQSLIVYYGLKSLGAERIRERLKHLSFEIPTGVNIAKTNRADIKGERSVEDYVATYRMLSPLFTYVTLNVSCPNTQDGRMFQDPRLLNDLLAAIAKEKKNCPVFLKISADLTTEEVDAILDVAGKYAFVDGFIVANLSKRRDGLAMKSPPERLGLVPLGGISGRPVRGLSTNLVRYIYRKTNAKYVIIGLGGIFTAEDAYEKIKAGASLVQMITGLIYGGPAAVKRINKGLAELLARDGFSHVNEAVGKEA